MGALEAIRKRGNHLIFGLVQEWFCVCTEIQISRQGPIKSLITTERWFSGSGFLCSVQGPGCLQNNKRVFLSTLTINSIDIVNVIDACGTITVVHLLAIHFYLSPVLDNEFVGQIQQDFGLLIISYRTLCSFVLKYSILIFQAKETILGRIRLFVLILGGRHPGSGLGYSERRGLQRSRRSGSCFNVAHLPVLVKVVLILYLFVYFLQCC